MSLEALGNNVMNDRSSRYGASARGVNVALVAICAMCAAIIGIATANAAGEKPVRILAIGTSLTAGYQVPAGKEFTAVLEARLKKDGYNVRVVNAGVSGDTSAGGLARLDWALSEPFDAAIVELGSNDALRAQKPSETEANLDAILTKLKAKNIKVLLAGMMAPRNLGPDYAKDFDAIYPRLAKKHGVAFYPFFLDGVAGQLKLNQPDGIHPNEAGTAVIVGKIAPYVAKLLLPPKKPNS
jgi:acyl-CoA thioesterase I